MLRHRPGPVVQTGRYAILEHRSEETHWDVLLECGESLRTWAVDAPIAPGCALPARSLADHRRLYLDYEGPISGGRGEVRRVAGGLYEAEVWAEDRVVATLKGDQLIGWLVLSRGAGGEGWTFFFEGKFD